MDADVSARAAHDGEVVLIRRHSELVYWWIVWAYCALGAAATIAAPHAEFDVTGGQLVSFIQSQWLGLGFVGLVGLVLFLTHANLRGVTSLLLIVTTALIVALLQLAQLLPFLTALMKEAVVVMNLAFYVGMFAVIFFAWFVVTFVIERHPVWKVSADNISFVERFLERERTFAVTTLEISLLPSDLIVWSILGLGQINDIELTYTVAGGRRERHVLRNVWGARRIVERVQRVSKHLQHAPAQAGH
jgi:hypothetical protein